MHEKRADGLGLPFASFPPALDQLPRADGVPPNSPIRSVGTVT